MLRFAFCFLLLPTLAFGQTNTGASVMVTQVADSRILAANNIDDVVPANMAGRLAFALIVQEWIDYDSIDPGTILKAGDEEMLVSEAQNIMLYDGREGEMARALLAQKIGYTPDTLTQSMISLFDQIGADLQDFGIQKSSWGGPEWVGNISLRDMSRIAMSLVKLHGTSLDPFIAGAGQQCLSYGVGEKSGQSMISIVSGAASPTGCLTAARESLALIDTRLDTLPDVLTPQ